MIAFAKGQESKGRRCPNCGYQGSGWSWADEAHGNICPKCHKIISAYDGAIMEQRVEATVFYQKGRGWMISTRYPTTTTIAGPFAFKEAAISEAKRDDPDEIIILDS